MKGIIIDASAAPLRDYVIRYGRSEGLLYAAWFRLLRPAMVTVMWVLFALYVHHSLVTVGGTAAEVAELVVYVGVVAGMATLLVSWMIICGFHDWIRLRDQAEVEELYRPGPTLASAARLGMPEGAQRLLVRHDESGRIVRVERWTPGVPTIGVEQQERVAA
ncbi:hypothetical protein FOZ76_03720 [Verticiella sediminum]|uniref:Poly-beta-1,6-N-acetyl-D-glucosamine biosynthesis protein PgaD n=1 Tax=Verticiella sediminum TaxID=1247510 RepID=A0A556AY95_9BURK|nr:hypothetical protein [Verticiella sediminum]TSH97910.1 hypothetical protein FOZ76_03720 [Verticiella sediminum]